MKSSIVSLLLLSLLSACSYLKTPPITAIVPLPEHEAQMRINDGTVQKPPVCVLIPRDTSHMGEAYSGSGKAITAKIRAALRKENRPSIEVDSLEGRAYAICSERGAFKAISTAVLHYEDRKSGLFGKPDRIELKLSLIDIESLQTERSVFFEAKTNLYRSFLTELGNNAPSELLGAQFDAAVKAVVEPGHANSFGIE